NVVSVDGKAFSQRLKLGGSALNGTSDRDKAVGDEISGLKDGRYFEFAALNATTTAGATSKTLITIYGTTGSAGQVRKLTLYKVDENGKMTVAGTNSLNDQVKKYTYVVDDAATYRLASENSGCNVYYFQIDKILIGEEDAQDVTPAGNPTPVGIEVDTSAAKLVYKKDETVSTEGVVVTFVQSNAATCDRTEDVVTTGITYSEVSTGSLGEKDVTVTYNDGTNNYTAKYKITVESAVAGVWGANGKLSDSLVTALPEGSAADATITVALGDLEAEIVGNSATAKATVTAATYKAEGAEGDGTEITADGVDIGKGKYVITATVKVTDGDDEATFEVEIGLSVSIAGELETVTVTFETTGSKMDIEESTVSSIALDT
ncbi:MAG: hypothetical protein K2G26_04935, partial [Clostridia bacterium]|nr:hypothetical protein [Clostridia bacterium]